DLTEMELKKILIEKMEGNKSIQRSDEQRNLYKALVDAYAADKTILESYGDTSILKRRRGDDDDQEGPSLDQTGGQRDEEKVGSLNQLALHLNQQPEVQAGLQQGLNLDRCQPVSLLMQRNLTLPAIQGSAQTWISELEKKADSRSSFNELLDTPIDFSNFIMNRLCVDTLTPELLAGPTYELMRGSCNSLTELEYHLEEVYKATTDQLDWVNPEGQQYPHNLLQPLPLIPDNRGRRVIPFAHFINNDLEYLRGGASSRKYTTSMTKTKAADYGHIKWIEDLVPRNQQPEVQAGLQQGLNLDRCQPVSLLLQKNMYRLPVRWTNPYIRCLKQVQKINRLFKLLSILNGFPSQGNLQHQIEPLNYDKHALWGVSHWGRKRQQFYGFAVNWESALDVYSKRRIIAVTDLNIIEWHNYKHLDWISLSNLTDEERFAFNVSLRMFTRSIVIQRRVEDLQLGVESYQKRLNLPKPDTYRSDLKRREAYTAYSNPRGFIYQNKDKKNRLMWIDELYKFSDGTLNDVHNAPDDSLKGIRMQYLPQTIWKKGDKDRAAAMIQSIDKILNTRRIMRSLERFVGGRLYEGDFRMLQRTI
nr:hypothetical protein [Tanacetum cinerariifolium]